MFSQSKPATETLFMPAGGTEQPTSQQSARGALWLLILGTLTLWFSPGASLGAGARGISPSALAEIRGLEQEKLARTPAPQKLDSNLIYARNKARTGAASPAAPHLQPDVKL